jgi:acyl transferase domain-containing protein
VLGFESKSGRRALIRFDSTLTIFLEANKAHLTLGEIAAAYTAGCLSLSEAITIAYCRGITVSKNKQDGLMLAVGLGEEEVRPIIENAYHDTGIAAVNSANSVTLSGGASDIKSLSELFHGKGVFSKILKTGGNAYHSSHMLHLGLIYESLLTQALDELNSYKISEDSIEPCQALWISSVFPHAAMSKAATRPLYWRQNLESKVHFQAAVEQMIDSSKVHVDVLIEIGPHSALKSPLTQIWAAKRGENSEQQFYYSALTRRRDGMDSLLQLCGSLFCANFPVDLEAVNAQDCLLDGRFTLCHGRICTALPSYSFSYGSILYNESRFSKDIRLRKHIRHDLLGSKQAGCSLNSPSWRNVLRIKDLPWLEHHKVCYVDNDG